MAVLLRRLTRKWVIVGVAGLAVLGGGSALAATQPWHKSADAATTQIVTARRTTIVQTVAASGTISAAKEAGLNFAVSGRITHVLAKVGDVVRKGDTLATVGKAALVQERSAAAATVVADEAKVAADSAGSAQQAADAAALAAARSSLDSARQAVKDARLKSTINGTVTAVNLTKGEAVSGSSQSGLGSQSGDSSSAQISVQSTRTFVVDATVDDTQISEVKRGQDVAITPEGAGTTVAGTVTSVSKVPSSSAGVVSFPITVSLTGHPADVYAGSSATLSITTDKAVNVLAIPTLAITYDGSAASVELKSGGSTKQQTITVGQTYGLQTEVKSGLQPGDQVVVRIPTFARIGTTSNGNGGGFGREGGFPTGGGFPGGGSFTGGPQSFSGGG
ncbi:MAG TPA: HlyD family efflux transporter periplasmic adaptor subunit [Mycobacteriales bacterium]|nr:HlyD family efflux transporter periplasmic adaptor subunit [Mycobacteriales bacterium]